MRREQGQKYTRLGWPHLGGAAVRYRIPGKKQIRYLGARVPCSLLLPLAGGPCLEPSARLSAPHLSFPNIPSPAPIAQSCLAAVGPAAPGAHLQRLQPARLVAFWTLFCGCERIGESADLSAAHFNRPYLLRFLVTSWTLPGHAWATLFMCAPPSRARPFSQLRLHPFPFLLVPLSLSLRR